MISPRKLYPHAKPIGLITQLIGAVTLPGDLVVDPAAGSFVVMHAAHTLGREFIGCDITYAQPRQSLLKLDRHHDEVGAFSSDPP